MRPDTRLGSRPQVEQASFQETKKMDAKELKLNAERCGRLARGCNDENIAREFRFLAREFLARAHDLATVAATPQPRRRSGQG